MDFVEACKSFEVLYDTWCTAIREPNTVVGSFDVWLQRHGWMAFKGLGPYTLGIPESLRALPSEAGCNVPGTGDVKMSDANIANLSYQELEDTVVNQDERLRRRERLSRRMTACVVANLEGDPSLEDEGELISAAKQTYRQTYGCPIIGFILLHIIIGVIAQLIVRWIVKKWNERHQDDVPQDQFVVAATISLAEGARAKLRADAA